MRFTVPYLVIGTMIASISMESSILEPVYQEVSAGTMTYVHALSLWQAHSGLEFDVRAMREAGPATSTLLVVVPATVMSAVVEADPDNIASDLYLLASGLLIVTFGSTRYRSGVNNSQFMLNQAAALAIGLLSSCSSKWHLEDHVRKSILRIVLAVVPPLMSHWHGEESFTRPHMAGLLLNICLVTWNILSAPGGMQKLGWLQMSDRVGSKTFLKRDEMRKGTNIALWIVALLVGLGVGLMAWFFPNPLPTLRRFFKFRQSATQISNTPQHDATEMQTSGISPTDGPGVDNDSCTKEVIAKGPGNAADDLGEDSGSRGARQMTSSSLPRDSDMSDPEQTEAIISADDQDRVANGPRSINSVIASDVDHAGKT